MIPRLQNSGENQNAFGRYSSLGQCTYDVIEFLLFPNNSRLLQVEVTSLLGRLYFVRMDSLNRLLLFRSFASSMSLCFLFFCVRPPKLKDLLKCCELSRNFSLHFVPLAVSNDSTLPWISYLSRTHLFLRILCSRLLFPPGVFIDTAIGSSIPSGCSSAFLRRKQRQYFTAILSQRGLGKI